MSAIAQIRALFEYNEWANGHVLTAAHDVAGDDLRRELGASFGSVQGNLTHMLFAQNIWLSRWTDTKFESPMGETDLVRIAEALKASDAAMLDYVSALRADDLERQLHYTDTQGNRQQATLWHTMLHVTNHGTHHRAEIALLLTSLGHPPRQLDFAFFQLEKAGGAPRLT